MCTYLIDYENLNGERLAKLGPVKKGDEVIVFYSQASRNPNGQDDVKRFLGKAGGKLACEEVVAGSKDALDFQLSVKLGLLAKGKRGSQLFRIVSNDKGFDCVVGYLKQQGFRVDRVGASWKKGDAKQKQKLGSRQKPNPAQTHKLKSASKLTRLLAKEDKPEEVCRILHEHHSGKSVCEALDKLYRDNKHTSKVYREIKPLVGK